MNYDEKKQEDDENISINELSDMLNDDDRFSQVMKVYSYTSNVSAQSFEGGLEAEDIDEDIISDNVIFDVIDKSLPYGDFIGMYSYKDDSRVAIDDDGVVISQSLAESMNVKTGDYIFAENDNEEVEKLRVSNIITMYVGDYIFMSTDYYNSVYGDMPDNNSIMAKLVEKGTDVENSIGMDYLNKHGVGNITFFTDTINRFTNMIQSLDIVTLVLIVSSALLAFVVLYNLTNVNISERIREIATLKVLGFYDKEVSAYIYRENILLTIIGGVNVCIS